jgi:redox-sensitive bicupin YhaK (pirin superfamily)
MKTILIVAALLAAPSMALAHGPKTGANGGVQVDAGSFHVEVVSKGTSLQVFLRDHSDKAVTTNGFKGTAIFVVEGKPQRILLTPAGENRLSGTASVTLPTTPKGAVQITTPSGSTMQAKF